VLEYNYHGHDDRVADESNFIVQILLLFFFCTHEILREPAPGAPVDEHASVAVHVGHVHGRALHLRVREPHLQVKVVHVLEELAKVPSGGPDGRVVAQVAEEPHEAPAEVPHEPVGGRLDDRPGLVRRDGEQHRGGGGQLGHQPVRVYLVGVEHVPLAPGQPDHLAPSVLTILELQ